ncbi:TonB-dependent receptor [Arcicella sp. DC2W]|uniref:TonB-dependent receptor n=1 Tax=Arcicella gelida TaxID=2984195 RepID=A0ABU5S2R3_9BACT|nr:TonB-dependent receptor [Arcicella sp. DC2W]MEA5402764.1 TonB-dependent receptor [Arcicella sp. DC2W]
MKKDLLSFRFGLLLVVFFLFRNNLKANLSFTEKQYNKHTFTPKKKLKEVLQELKKYYQIDILFFDKNVEGFTVNPAKLDFHKKIEYNLDILLKPFNLTYSKTQTGVYVIFPNKANSIKENTAPQTANNKQSSDNILSIINITGIVKDSTGKAISGVNILLKNTQKGTYTDENGHFKISAPVYTTLIFSYIGFKIQEILVENQTNFSIVLREETNTLDEIEIISTGYEMINKRDHTGATGSIKMSDLSKAPVRSVDEALGGRIAGVQVVSPDGQPGANSDIVIRGIGSISQATSPLYIIDGFILENINFNALNIDDIASIEILKDASATAIYGSRGSSGVVVMTTKRGKNLQPTFIYNTYYGVQSLIKKMDVLDAYNFVKLQSEINPTWTAQNYFTNGKTLESYRNAPTIDWQDKMFNTVPYQNHSLSLSGSTGKTNYLLSGNFINQNGILIKSGFKRYQGRFTLDQEINQHFKIGITSNYSIVNTFGNIANTQTLPTARGVSNHPSYNLMYNIWSYRPLSGLLPLSEFENTLEDSGAGNTDLDRFNPYIQAINEVNEYQVSTLTSNAYLEYNWSKDIKVKLSGSLNLQSDERQQFYNSQTKAGSSLSLLGALNGANGSISSNNNINYQVENLLFYNKSFHKNHQINVLAGFTLQKNTSKSKWFSAIQVPNELLGVNGLDEGTPYRVGASSTGNAMLSYLGRINYSFRNKYLFTTTFRADGSSKFLGAHRWGYFPSGAIAWRISDEPFMKNLRFISEAKLRASYGLTGNNRVSDFATVTSIGINYNGRYSFNNEVIQGTAPTALANPNLSWETATMLDIGLEMAFLNHKATVEIDYYQKRTNDLLLDASVSSTTGFVNAIQNIGNIRNEGLELTFQWVNVKTKNFTWNSNFNIAFNRNRVLGLANNEIARLESSVSNSFSSELQNIPLYIAKVGQPVAQFYGYIADGLYQIADFDKISTSTNTTYILKDGVAYAGTNRNAVQPGDIKLKDINGDGILNNNDMTVIGTPLPIHIGGFSNTMNYKGFECHIFGQWSYGNQVFNGNRLNMEGVTTGDNRGLGLNMFAVYSNHWTFENQNAKYPRALPSPSTRRAYTSDLIEDASYLRLKTLSLGYKIPKKYLAKTGIELFRIYVAAQNLITWTRYQGPDPEVSTKNSPLTPGFDFSPYPRAKSIVMGINLTF